MNATISEAIKYKDTIFGRGNAWATDLRVLEGMLQGARLGAHLGDTAGGSQLPGTLG